MFDSEDMLILQLCAVAIGLILVAAIGGYLIVGANSTGEPGASSIQFREVSAEAGMIYKVSGGRSSGTFAKTGVYITDFNNDGWSDILLIGGTRPVLFENVGGEFERSGALPLDQFSSEAVTGALFFDYNNDGLDDLIVLLNNARPVLLENTGGGFEQVDDAGFETALTAPIGATAADYDGDGDLDLFVIQHGDWSEEAPAGFHHPSQNIRNDTGYPNVLYENEGGTFDRVDDAGITGTRWSLAASFVDLTGDGAPDIHVANDFNNDTLYVNRGDTSFERVVLGTATDRNAMSSEVADFTGDSQLDVFVTNIYFPRNDSGSASDRQPIDGGERERTNRIERMPGMNWVEQIYTKNLLGNNLLVNDGNGSFSDQAAIFGVKRGGWGWAASSTDFDNDGDRDLFHANQRLEGLDRYIFSVPVEESPYLATPMLWARTESGFKLLNATTAGFEPTDGRGVAALDFDHDGDQDLIIANQDGAFKLYENIGARGNWLSIAVRGNRTIPATGTRVYVTIGNETRLFVRNSKADYLSQETRLLHVGLGTRESADVRVVWPDGTQKSFESVNANHRLIVKPNDTAVVKELNTRESPLNRVIEYMTGGFKDWFE